MTGQSPMTLLNRDGVFVADPFVRDAAETDAGLLVPLADVGAALAGNARPLGVEVANTADPEALVVHFERLALISIVFPAFSDGRGFSLARRLRRLGFKGALRATGPLIADQFAYALDCGFDEIDLPEDSAARQPAPIWATARAAMTLGYQRNSAAKGSILDQRKAARTGASHV